MTLNQLLKEVYALGFDEAEYLDESFVFCVNRALKMIFTELAPPTRAKISITENDIKSFDLEQFVKKPLIIISAPQDSYGRIIDGAYTDGYNVTLPNSFTGEAVILYKPMPKELTVDLGEENINLPYYTSHLLPLLTAFFVLLDDDPEKAEYYMNIYRSESNKLRHLYPLSQNNTYTDVTGWA